MSTIVPFRALPLDLEDVVYAHGPDSVRAPGTAPGETEEIVLDDSALFPGTRRRVWIHMPAGIAPGEPTGVVVFQDGAWYLDPDGEVRGGIVLDNLTASGAIPPTIGVFVEPGTRDIDAEPSSELGAEPGPTQRNLEYDAADDTYARFLLDEVLPLVRARRTILDDPRRTILCGGSSGGDCSFTAAWHRPDAFGGAICCLSSFAQMPGGNPYPRLIASTPTRPLRFFLQIGQRDLNHDQPHMNWLAENLRTAASLAEAGYDLRVELGDGGHSPNHGGVVLPDALRWMLRDSVHHATS